MDKKSITVKKAVFSALLCALLLIACEKNPPEINNIIWQLNFSRDLESGRDIAHLSLFINASDEDGLDDIETIFLFNDKEELYWEINSDNWYKSESWLGVNSIRMPDDSAPPDGEYRIVLQDIGGETDEEYINIKSSGIRKVYPDVKIKDGKLSITGSQEYYAVQVYNNSKFLTNYIYKTGKEIDTKQEILVRHNIPQSAFFDVYYFDKKQEAGFAIGPYYF